MLSSLLNLPRRRKSGSVTTSQTITSDAMIQDTGREEDGFVLVGQSASERNTVMPASYSGGVSMPPPPSYAQITGSPSLPPATIDPSFGSQPSPSPATVTVFPTPRQYDQVQQTSDNRTPNTAATNSSLSTSPGLDRSSNSNWGIVDVPFQLSSAVSGSNRLTTDYFVPRVHEVDWTCYNYDFQFEVNVKREAEMTLESMEVEG